ncbi:hypothetical protein PS2_033713 [Malus domestica]
MICRTLRSAPVVGRVQECVAMFRRAIGGEVEAHAKAKSESVQGHNRKKKGHKDLEAELAAAKLRYGPCGVCGKDKDHTSAGCPYVINIPNPLEVTLVDGRYGIVCDCCAQPGGHPTRQGWTGRATLKLCTYCMVLGEHWITDCPCVEPQQREKWRKEMREDDILGEEPKKEEFLDLEAYLRDLRMMAELKPYDG